MLNNGAIWILSRCLSSRDGGRRDFHGEVTGGVSRTLVITDLSAFELLIAVYRCIVRA